MNRTRGQTASIKSQSISAHDPGGYFIRPAKQPEREFALDFKPATTNEVRDYAKRYVRRRARRAVRRMASILAGR